MLFSNINVLLGDATILNNAYVSVVDKKIAYIGTDKPVEFSGEIYDGKDKLLMPGLINTHCHVPMTLLRGLGADLPLDRWLNEAIFPVEAKLNGEFDYWGTMMGIAEMLRSGVTSFNDMYFYGPYTSEAVLETGIKANISLGIVSFDESVAVESLKEFKNSKYLFENYNNANEGQLKIDMCIHGEYTSNPRTVIGVSEYAKEVGANMHIHLSETEKETRECIERHGKTPTAYFNDLGLFDSKTTAAHCVHMTDEDMDILKEKNVTVAHCPISNLKLGSGIADIVKMQDKGIVVSIGTDGVASNDNLNILEDIKFVPLIQKGFNGNPSILKSDNVIRMATKNGAVSQSRLDTGEIKVGNRADMIVVDFNTINMQPALDMKAGFIYSSTPENVKLTMVDGKILYRNGCYLTLDVERVLSEVSQIKEKLYK